MFYAIARNPVVVASFADIETATAHADETEAFVVAQESDLNEFTKAELVAIYNATIPEGSNIAPVDTFKTKPQAVGATWANLSDADPAGENADADPAGENAPKARKLSRGINLAPKAKVLPCRAGTKQAAILDLISRPEGATMDELREALSGSGRPWLDVSIKAGLTWDMNSVKGYGVRTSIRGEGENAVHAYHAVYPEGQEAPLAHTPRAADRKAAEAEATEAKAA